MESAALGPEYSDDEIRAELERSGLSFTESGDIASDSAALLADGKIVCWHQGRLEFGPRALGNRSILADPRKKQLNKRLNEMKSREPWRPFGPSILRGREKDFFDHSFNSPFMLFTFPVMRDKRQLIPVVVHADGTTRPQSVDRNTNPLFHSMISKFEKLTSIPMVVNTSFNTGGEPIACSPGDSLRNFVRLEADYLAIGDYLVENKLRKKTSGGRKSQPASGASEAPAPNRRLHLRLGTTCNNNCAHCTILDLNEWPERTTEAAVFELAAGRNAGCTELVFMRGEPTLRKDLPALVKTARELGYSHIQIQTNGRRLADGAYLDTLIRAGVNFFELSLYGDTPESHGEISGAENAFAETIGGIKNVVAREQQFSVTVPVVRKNFMRLPGIVALLNRIGVRGVQFNLPRPMMVREKWRTETVARLSECSLYIRRAMLDARAFGMAATTEGVPLCHLKDAGSDAAEDREEWKKHRVADLNFIHDSFIEHRIESRPFYPQCAECSMKKLCPSTWKAYLDIFGGNELKPVV
jgi:MoaA/NifB/PqqE/SkfB family radical SAM enzyme